MGRRKHDFDFEAQDVVSSLRDRFYTRLEAPAYEATLFFDGRPIALLKLASDDIEEARGLINGVIGAYEHILKRY